MNPELLRNMAARIVFSIVVNIISYSVIFPFAGAFVLSLCHIAPQQGPLGVLGLVIISPIVGSLAIVMYWKFGLVTAMLASIFVLNRRASLIGNMLCSIGLTWHIHNMRGNILSDYAPVMYLVSVFHALALTRITQSVLSSVGQAPPGGLGNRGVRLAARE